MKIDSSWNKDTHQLLLRIYDDNNILQDEKYVKIREGVVDGYVDGQTLRLKLNSGESIDIALTDLADRDYVINQVNFSVDKLRNSIYENLDTFVGAKINTALATFSVDTNENYIQDTYDVPCCRPDLEGADTQFEFNLNVLDRFAAIDAATKDAVAHVLFTKTAEEGVYNIKGLTRSLETVFDRDLDTGMHSAIALNKDLAEEELYPEDVFKAIQYLDGEFANKTIDAKKNHILNLSSYDLSDREELVCVGDLDEAVNDVLEEATKASKATAEEYTDNKISDAFNDVTCNGEEIIFKTKGGQTKTLLLKPYATDVELADAIFALEDYAVAEAGKASEAYCEHRFDDTFNITTDNMYVKMGDEWKRIVLANDGVKNEESVTGKLYEHYIYIHYNDYSYCTLVIRDGGSEEFNLLTLAKWLYDNGFTNPYYGYKAFGAHGRNTYYVSTLARKEAGTPLEIVNHINYIYSEDGETLKYNTDTSPDMGILDPTCTDKVRRLI